MENSLLSLYATKVPERKLKAVLSIIRYVYKFVIPGPPSLILPLFLSIITDSPHFFSLGE
jgi:hypothetical protein